MHALMSIGQASLAGGAVGPPGGHHLSIVGKVPASEPETFSDAMAASQGSTRSEGTTENLESSMAVGVEPLAVSTAPTDRVSAALAEMVDSLGRNEASIDRLIQRGMRGRALSQDELLRMQALVYRYSQKLEVASRLTESVASSVKQILSIQV